MCLCAGLKSETVNETPAKRDTVSIRLSPYASHNAFHHCEHCHHYCEAGPATQVCTSITTSLLPVRYIPAIQQVVSLCRHSESYVCLCARVCVCVCVCVYVYVYFNCLDCLFI